MPGQDTIEALALGLVQRHAETGERQIVGIVGPPGTGKSTFAQQLATQFALGDCVIVPMDGFHLANSIIGGTDLASRKGAIDTFDGGGYVSLLARLRAGTEPIVYAPSYRRGLEEPISASVAVPAATPFVLTEGNYLLAPIEPWNRVSDYLDEVWFIDTPRDTRIEQLIERHIAFGKDRAAATAWALGPDEVNARYVAATRARADRVVAWP